MKPWRTLILAAWLAGAAGALDSTVAAAGAAPGAQVSMDQAVKMAEQRYHAKVVKAEAQRNGAQTVYVLRLLNEAGKVWTVHVDASNGAMQ
ncbi:MAG: PepSY domain-containing protein [Proteobacteria bacterium]|nr:PepSY domain-containing protein [Pseudomonadota bacterium]